MELPLVPCVVVLRGRKPNGFLRFGPREVFVSQFARKISRQDRMVRLANQDKMIAVLLNDHFAALIAATAYAHALQLGRIRLAGYGLSYLLLNYRIMHQPISH